MRPDHHAELEELSLDELRSTTGGCELICALAKGAGYLYEQSKELAREVWTAMLESQPPTSYLTHVA